MVGLVAKVRVHRRADQGPGVKPDAGNHTPEKEKEKEKEMARRRRGKEKQKRAARLDGVDFFVKAKANVRGGRPLREGDEAGGLVPSLVLIAATAAVCTQCRIYKDDAILADVISRELGWHVASVPPTPASGLSCFFV